MSNERKESPTQMACEEVRDLLYLYVTQELEEAERSAVESHLKECADCRTACEEHKKLSGGLGGLFRNRNLYYYSINN